MVIDTKFDFSKTYYKITNEDECHNKFQYKDGLNIDTVKFSEQDEDCVPGGLYFSDLDYISNFILYGIWIREVTIPTDAKIKRIDHDKWRADRIILGNKYSLFDIDTLIKIGLDIQNLIDNHLYIDHISEYAQLNLLKDLENKGYNFSYTYDSIDRASANGHVNILEYWKDKGNIKYTSYAMDEASENGQIDSLDWWKNSGLELKYSSRALALAGTNGYIDILQWWKDSKLRMIIDETSIDWASLNEQIDVLNWWKDSGIKLQYSKVIIEYLIPNKLDKSLKWWKDNGLYNDTIVDNINNLDLNSGMNTD